jgi:hypothetical protein
MAQGAGMPALRVGQQPLAIASLDIKVQVVGTLATTTWDMTFQNPQDRVLEGELVFPLAEGQSVSRFALPVNGVLREGVVVPKAKGQEAFEAVVRRPNRVDPGLLEKTEGNSFRARIYPIPARGTYRVVIAYEQELGVRGNAGLAYRLPLAFQDPVGNFALHLEVEEQTVSPRARASYPGLTFRQEGRVWRADYFGRNVRLDRPLEVSIPRNEGHQATFIHREGGLHRFYTQLRVAAHRKPKEHPRSILVVWDASASATRRDLVREKSLLAAYLKAWGEVHVEVVVVRNDMEAPVPFQIRQGNSEALRHFLDAVALDGGTRLDALHLAGHGADEVLLFSDGMATLGSAAPEFPEVPVTVINSAVQGRHAWLRGLAEGKGGEYLNLQEMRDAEALACLQTRPLAFLGLVGAPGDVHEVYPAKGEVVRGTFGIAGMQISERARVTLKFGYGTQVAFTQDLVLDGSTATVQPLATRIWAQKKLAALQAEPDQNREEILHLGQAHGLVTEETSLIVLETAEDYARFQIEPPSELKAAYDQRVAQASQEKSEVREARLQSLIRRLGEEKTWWAETFDPPPVMLVPAAVPAPAPPARPAPTPAPAPAPAPAPVIPAAPPLVAAPATPPRPAADYNFLQATPTTGSIRGLVHNSAGAPLAGAQVRFESAVLGGGPRTTSCDAAGQFAMRLLPPGEYRILVQHPGFSPVRGDLRVSVNQVAVLTFRMSSEAMAVVEVVGTSASVDMTTTQTATSYSTETLDSIPRSRDLESTSQLAPGVQPGGNRFFVDGMSTVDHRRGFQGDASQDGAGTGQVRGKVEIAAWSVNAPYLSALREAQPQERYLAYLNLRKVYASTPGFYLDVCDFFETHKDLPTAIRVLSNLAELELDHPGLLRVLAHRLLKLGAFDLAIQTFERVLKLRPEEPQSLRDLGLAHARAGHFQVAADTLYQVLVGQWDARFQDVDLITLNELNALIATHPIGTGAFDPRVLASLPVDIRVVLTWDTNDSDMDLHVTDPRGEKCLYSHNRTALGGRISRDITQGYGPEEFMLRKSIPGIYRIEANYFGTRQQTAVVGPTTLKAELFLHFGTPQEVRKEIILKLDGRGQTLAVGTFQVE